MHIKYNRFFLVTLLLTLFSCGKDNSIGDQILLHKDNPISTNDLKGHWVVVNYWADWCPPCIKEIPELSSFAKDNPDVRVFAFNFDRIDGAELDQQIARFGVEYPSLITHPSSIWGIKTPSTLPATFFIDPSGVLVEESRKPLDQLKLEAIISLLKET